MLKAAVRSPCRSGRAVCFHTANGVFLYPRRQIESTPQSLIQTLAHAEMVAAGGSSVAGEQDGGPPMWCVKRLRVVSWLVGGRRVRRCGSWRAGSGCGGGPGRGRPGPRRFVLVAFALVVDPGDGVGAQ